MNKFDNAYKTIGEVVKILNLKTKKSTSSPTHTIRFWEKEFKQIKPKIFNGKRRYYDKKNIELLKKIHFLLKEQGMTLNGVKKILDIGCGGGILSEELSKMGAKVTGIDSSKKSINIAQKHAKEQDLDIEYINGSILDISNLGNYDCIICLEMIEHIHEPKKLIEKIKSVSQKKSHLFMSTINRNLKSFIFAKIFAEYVLNVVPKGTHQYAKFITPYELNNMLEQDNFTINSIDGVLFNPINESFALGNDTKVNYFLHAEK